MTEKRVPSDGSYDQDSHDQDFHDQTQDSVVQARIKYTHIIDFAHQWVLENDVVGIFIQQTLHCIFY